MEIDSDGIKRIAEIELSSAQESKIRLLDEHSAAFRWLIASLLAVNGGGILALVDVTSISVGFKLLACGIFVSGTFFALLAAWLSQRANRSLLEPLAKMSAYWLMVAQSGEADEELHKEIIDEVKLAIRKARPTQISGWLAAAAFVCGSISAGVGLWSHSADNAQVQTAVPNSNAQPALR